MLIASEDGGDNLYTAPLHVVRFPLEAGHHHLPSHRILKLFRAVFSSAFFLDNDRECDDLSRLSSSGGKSLPECGFLHVHDC